MSSSIHPKTGRPAAIPRPGHPNGRQKSCHSAALPTKEFGWEKQNIPTKRIPHGSKCVAEVTFEPNYESDASKIALRQLGKAGFRLAALLTAILDSRRRYSPMPKIF